jgi:hypothetical protein
VPKVAVAISDVPRKSGAGSRALQDFVARHAGIDREEAVVIVNALAELGVVARSKKKLAIRERWLMTFDLRRDLRVVEKVRSYWLARAAERAARATEFSDDERFSYFVFSASAVVARAVDVEYTEFLMRAIALAEGQRDGQARRQCVRVLGLQLFSP